MSARVLAVRPYYKYVSISDMHKGMIVLNIQRWVLCIKPFASIEINKAIISWGASEWAEEKGEKRLFLQFFRNANKNVAWTSLPDW